jgi:hypothetical protein
LLSRPGAKNGETGFINTAVSLAAGKEAQNPCGLSVAQVEGGPFLIGYNLKYR